MPDNRLRQRPAERFALPAQVFDLHAEAAALRAEPSVLHQGHRQKALYKHGDTTTALFAFEAGGTLPPHAAGGTVTILALEGEFEVVHGGRLHRLAPGQLIAFAPDVPHDVRSPRGGVMLLTVALESENGR
jgi:quercetin dioxygenase-like cupin family protein